jgi:hypothetical protein
MSAHPYRFLSRKKAVPQPDAEGANGDLLPALWLFWTLTVLRLIAGLVRHEAFATELSVVLLIAVLAPFPLLRASLRKDL